MHRERNNPFASRRAGCSPAIGGSPPVSESCKPVRIANRWRKARAPVAMVLGLVLCCCGCAGAPRDSAAGDDVDTEHDPAEPVNRAIFKANVAADHAVVKPVA